MADGVWNEAGTSFDFSIAPAYYQTWWFRTLCVAAFLALLWALYQRRLWEVAREYNMRLDERVNERTRVARELHDTLLQSFQGLMFQFQAARNMLPGSPEKSMQALDEAILATEQAIGESRDAIRGLRPQPVDQCDLAGLLKAAGQELAGNPDGKGDSPSLRVIVEGEPQKLRPLLHDEVYRIVREVLRNAFRHAQAHHIEAELRYGERWLRLRVRDDGKGIDPKILERKEREGHWGLPGVRERAKRIGARLDLWSEEGAGTEVELTVPAAIAYESRRNRPRFAWFRLFHKAEGHEQRS